MAKEKTQNKIVSFYGGQVQIEIKPWGDHFRYIKIGTTGGTLSATGITKHLDKSRALLPWAVGLVGSHIKSHFESAKSATFSKEEIFLTVEEALKKPEEAKVKGGDAGTLIHEYAHAFAKAHIAKTPLPDVKHLDPKNNDVHAKALHGISAFLDWFNKRKSIRFIEMETLLYYNSLLAGDTKPGEEVIEFLGIEDLFAEVDGVYETVDYKTSKGVYSDQRYQVSCYFKARCSNPDNKLKPKNSLILNFNKETGDLIEKRIPALDVEKDFKAFKGLHAVALREKELDEEYNQSKKNVSK